MQTSTSDAPVGLGELFARMRESWRPVTAIVIGAALLSYALVLVLPARYSTSLSFVIESRSSSNIPGDLAGLAGLAGLDIGQQESPQYYGRLLESRELLLLVADADTSGLLRAPARHAPRIGGTLGCNEDTEAERQYCEVKALSKNTRVDVDPRAKVVTITVTSRSPSLAFSLGRAFAAALNEFNVSLRQSRAKNERQFLESRAIAARQELEGRELAHSHFLEENRATANSPRLALDLDRLRRRADQAQEILSTLLRQLEASKLQELRSTPSITVIDAPYIPSRRSWPKGSVFVPTAVLAALVLCVWRYGLPRRRAPAGRGALHRS